MSKELLQGPNIVAVDQQVGGEGVPKGVAGCQLDDSSFPPGVVKGALNAALVEMMAPALSGMGVPVEAWRRKDKLPAPFPRRPGILARQGIGELSLTMPRPQIFVMQVLDSLEVLQEIDLQGRLAAQPGRTWHLLLLLAERVFLATLLPPLWLSPVSTSPSESLDRILVDPIVVCRTYE